MRQQGRVVDWQDDRGFGFIEAHDGGGRAFVHISAFTERSRRPANGDLVTYDVERDSQGRLQARSVKHVARRISRPASGGSGRLGFLLLFGFVLFLPGAVLFGRLPVAVLAWYAATSVLAYFVYAADKSAARRRGWRTKESSLHGLALVGGWPGALLAQDWLRHKSSKQSFREVFWITVVMNLAALAWLCTAGGRAFLDGLVAFLGALISG